MVCAGLHKGSALTIAKRVYGRTEMQCEVCSAVVSLPNNRLEKFRACSRRCASTLARQVDMKRGARSNVECGWCSGIFRVLDCHKDRKKFCGDACSRAWRANRMSNEGNPNWIDGRSATPYPSSFYRVRVEIIGRDGGVCRNPLCFGADECITVHHINYDKRDMARSNLITVCKSCNSRANFGRESWQRLYTELVSQN